MNTETVHEMPKQISALAISTLKSRAHEKKILQKDIALAVKLHRSTLNEHLNSEDMHIGEFFAIARAVGEDPQELIRTASQTLDRKDTTGELETQA